jgi:hypothetical protein
MVQENSEEKECSKQIKKDNSVLVFHNSTKAIKEKAPGISRGFYNKKCVY